MSPYRFQALGPLQAGEGSRAFLGLAISRENKAQPVVIVWVPDSAQKDAELLAKIRRETEHAAKLDHPHIVTVLGFASIDEGHARVVEFADGESLRKILETAKKLPPRLAARIVVDACTGAHYAHIAGNDDGSPLVHGDLRPETILISFGGITKVTGYGALAFAPREVGGQRVKGRRVHSAPEQIIGGRGAITVPTDVYLLGLALYECLTGVVPWADQGDFFDHAVLTLPLPPPTPGDIPEALEPIIQKACAKKAHDRYPTPLAMREAIEAAMGDQLATPEELSRFLEALFPQSHQLRADRRHTIDAGIADFVRRQWAEQEKRETVPMMRAVQPPGAAPQPPGPAAPAPTTPPPAPPAPPPAPMPAAVSPVPPPTVAPPPAPAPAARAAPAPARPATNWTTSEPDEEPSSSGGKTPWLIAAAVVVALLAGWWGVRTANAPIPGVEAPPPALSPTRPAAPTVEPAAAAPADAGAEVVDAGDAGAEPADAGLVDAGAPGAVTSDAGAAAPEVAAVVAISITSTPEVELLLDGVSLGRTPWSGRLPAGRRVFTLQNKALGINATRALTLRGEAVSEAFTFEKGFVAVTAPEGAAIFIDGVRVGTAPLRGEIPVYEGSHRITVNVGQSKWGEPFTLYGGQRVSFNVEMQ